MNKNGPAQIGMGDVPEERSALASVYVAYTDGACSKNPGPAGLGVVVTAPDGSEKELCEYLGHATNNIAELMAILRALEATPVEKKLVIYTDSQYSIGVLTKAWKAKANQELISDIKSALAKRKAVTFSYVRGHAGNPMNERVDKLARLAIELANNKS